MNARLKENPKGYSNAIKPEHQDLLYPDIFPIIGIGASAGGLEALEQFFGNVPTDSGMAYVVIQHLDPTQIGIMPELLQRITSMKVAQANDNIKIQPDCVYVIPPNKSMSILNRTLQLFEPVEIRGLRLPVDIFFRSLARDLNEKSIGIILSGMGSDGSLGSKAIKENNGLVLVQDPSTAKFDGMPGNALKLVIADCVASPAELPLKLIELLKNLQTAPILPETEGIQTEELSKIIILLREQCGQDFSLYKKATLFRRIERRKNVHQIDRTGNYVRYCQENPKELDILFKELLIGVTSFFRDPEVWHNLENKILPEMLNSLPNGYVIRAWVPACSTGEEAFSLAILFVEALEKIRKNHNISLQIFATDIDQDAIELARKSQFKKNIVSDVSPERLKKYFIAEEDGFRIHNMIREMVVFAAQSVIKDPPFTKLDMLSCRNMLIYMEAELQKKLFALFNYSLNPGGILLLGSAETLGEHSVGFQVLESKLKIYQRTSTLIPPDIIDFPSSFHYKKPIAKENRSAVKVTTNIQTIADQILLQRFSPASVLINDKGDIVYITGKTGKYLEPVAGKANWNIYVMAREGIQNELPGIFRKVAQSYEPVTVRNIKMIGEGIVHFVDITVQRIENPEAIRGMILVVFTDVPAIVELEKLKLKSIKSTSGLKTKELERELKQSFENLQSSREEMQTSQEELKSTNEELQSTNEELQSTNEELTTSKEEMQSLNEELQTVNIELQTRVGDFIRANDDMKNLLNSTEIATLFLDKELNIRRFTDETVHIFKLRATDIGRPFTDLVSDLKYPEIANNANAVIRTLIPIETTIATNDGRWFTVRIMPYRTIEDRIDGLVITFSNITVAKKLEIELLRVNEELREARKIYES